MISTEATQEAALEGMLDKVCVCVGGGGGRGGSGGITGRGGAAGTMETSLAALACLRVAPRPGNGPIMTTPSDAPVCTRTCAWGPPPRLSSPQVSDKWRHVELSLRPYKALKDTWVLGGVDEVLAVLEDSSVMMATILASRFVSGIR